MKKLLLLLGMIISVGANAQSKETSGGGMSSSISVYPNPASGTINISCSANEETRVVVRLTDMSGRTVLLKDDEVVKKGANTLRYSMAGVPVGTYVLRIQTGLEVTTAKVAVVE